MSDYIGNSSYLFGANETYVAELYEKYTIDPHSVDPSWAEFFSALGEDGLDAIKEFKGPSWGRRETSVIGRNGESGTISDVLEGRPPQPAQPAMMAPEFDWKS